MPNFELQASIACQPFIKKFWSLEKRAKAGDKVILFPDSHPEVLLNLGGQIQLISGNDSTPLPRFVSLGIQQFKLQLIVTEDVRFFSARLYPWAALGLPELVAPIGSVNDLSALLPELLPTTLADFAKMIEAFLIQNTDVISNLVQVFYKQESHVHVLDVLEQLHLSRRTLERFFEKNASISAKKLLQIRRFEKAMSLLYFYPESSLAELSLSLGYADQAHFQREFKQFSGMTPGQFAGSLLKVP